METITNTDRFITARKEVPLEKEWSFVAFFIGILSNRVDRETWQNAIDDALEMTKAEDASEIARRIVDRRESR